MKKVFQLSERLSLRTKLMSSFLLLMMMLLMFGIVSQRTFRSFNAKIQTLTGASNGSGFLARAMAARPEVFQYLFTGLAGYDPDKPKAEDAELVDMAVSAVDENFLNFTQDIIAIKATDEEKAAFEKFSSDWNTHKQKIQEAAKILKEGKVPKADLETRFKALADESFGINDQFGSMASLVKARATTVYSEAISVAAAINLFFIIAGIFALLLGILAIYTVMSVSKTIINISHLLTESSEKLLATSSQVARAGSVLSEHTSEQAASVEETSASMEQISAVVTTNAETANKASSLSVASIQVGEKSEARIKDLLTAMKDISESSGKIEAIVDVIDDIAFQTNLLALNAAVEAARAGEQGKGFAVVADAVRSLAQKSSQSAKEIATLISESAGKVETGVQIANSSATALAEMLETSRTVSTLNSKIAEISTEQSNSVKQVDEAMNQVDTVVQKSAATAEEIASSAEILHQQAEVLQEAVQLLTRVTQGSSNQNL